LNDQSFQPVSILFNEGFYRLQQTIELRAEDNGTATSPILLKQKQEIGQYCGGISLLGGNY
jgi:hypothetical protein